MNAKYPPADCVCTRISDLVVEIATPTRTKRYTCQPITAKDGAEIVGYTIRQIGIKEGYSVYTSVSPITCDCGDFEFRRRPCKHIQAVEQLC